MFKPTTNIWGLKSIKLYSLLVLLMFSFQSNTLLASDKPVISFDDPDGKVNPGQTFNIITSTAAQTPIAMFWGTTLNQKEDGIADSRLLYIEATDEAGEHSKEITIPDATPNGTIYLWVYALNVGFSDPTPLVIEDDDTQNDDIELLGPFKQWESMTIVLTGPFHTENDVSPNNPFVDRQLTGIFTGPNGERFNVPGYFSGTNTLDPHTGGTKWNIHFSPPTAGEWSYYINSRQGSEIAADLNLNNGEPSFLHGETGRFTVAQRDSANRGFLKYDGGHIFKYADGSEAYLAEQNSPENFLGAECIPGTRQGENGIGRNLVFDAHIGDYDGKGPLFSGDTGVDSKGMIGFINCIKRFGINMLYWIPMNIGGDGQNVFPYSEEVHQLNLNGHQSNDNLHFDLDKLRDWRRILKYAHECGIGNHIIFNEAEGNNKSELDNGTLGLERKIYYREMLARFGDFKNIYDVCEEYDLNVHWPYSKVANFAARIRALDPYGHPMGIHSLRPQNLVDDGFVGSPDFQFIAVQSTSGSNGHIFEDFRNISAQAGYPQVIGHDEPVSADLRGPEDYRDVVFASLLSGAPEWGMFSNKKDQKLDNAYEYQEYIRATGLSAANFARRLPYDSMTPNDNLITGDAHAMFDRGRTYAAFMPSASQQGYDYDLDGVQPGKDLRVLWYDVETRQTRPENTTYNGNPVELYTNNPNEKAVIITVLP